MNARRHGFRHACLIGLLSLATVQPAFALSGARAGSDRSASQSRPYPEQTCERLRERARVLTARRQNEPAADRAARLDAQRQQIERQLDQGGCNRSLR
jgi:hypothetical protein